MTALNKLRLLSFDEVGPSFLNCGTGIPIGVPKLMVGHTRGECNKK